MAPDERQLNERVGNAVRALREKAGYSTRELGRRAGISQASVSQIERGVSAPSMVTTYRLAEALGVLPGALLPTPQPTRVHLVRAGEGGLLPVANRPDAAVGRTLLMQASNPLEVLEYRIEPDQYIEEWFALSGELAMYLLAGTLDVELDGHDTVRLQAGDFLAHSAAVRHRWLLVDGKPAHVLLAVSHPAEGAVGRLPRGEKHQ